MDVKEIVTKYIALRDLKAKLEAAHKEKIAPIVAAQDKAEAALLALFNELGIDNAGCEAGTAYRSTRTSVTVADMDAFLGFVRDEGAWHMLERRAAKTAVEEYITANNDIPPGLNRTSEITINVRRS